MQLARLKKKSLILEAARQRLANLKAITPEPNFGPALTAASYEAKITSVADKLDAYNQMLAALDDKLNELDAEEAELNNWNRRILSAGEASFGPDSSEYEMLGGTRVSDRKKPTRKGGSGGGTDTGTGGSGTGTGGGTGPSS